MTTLPALLLAAAGIGFGHAVLPDHWMPLAVLSRARRYPTGRVVRLSVAAGLAHVLVSLLLGGVLMLVGLRFRDTVARHTDLVVGGILLLTGAVFLVLELMGRGHGHSHDHDHDHDHGHGDHTHGDDGHDGHDGHEHDHSHSHDDHHDHVDHERDHAHGDHLHATATATLVRPRRAVHDHAEPGQAPGRPGTGPRSSSPSARRPPRT